MTDERSQAVDAPGASPEELERLATRSGLYALLARGFCYPDEEVAAFLCSFAESAASDAGHLPERVAAVVRLAEGVTAADLQQAHMRLFGPMGELHPFETEQKGLQDFQKAQRMADVMGFYCAFGVEPEAERPDHVAAELEFMHYLALKQRHALLAGRPEAAALCAEAQGKFLRQHLGAWIGDFLAAARRAPALEPAPFYAALLDLLDEFIKSEEENLE
ncbi:MAG: TorD/DmsD family molecular chaperone [Planctomycetota bacterium]|jgi:TorA maturation chaperone TorD